MLPTALCRKPVIARRVSSSMQSYQFFAVLLAFCNPAINVFLQTLLEFCNPSVFAVLAFCDPSCFQSYQALQS